MNATPANTFPGSDPQPAPDLDTLSARRGKADRKSPGPPPRKFRVAATCRFVPTRPPLYARSICILLTRGQIFPQTKIYSIQGEADPLFQVDSFSPCRL